MTKIVSFIAKFKKAKSYYNLHMDPKLFKKEIKTLYDPDKILINMPNTTIIFNFPFCNGNFPYQFNADNDKYFTRIDLLTCISKTYKKIYKEENKTSNVPEETCEQYKKRTGCIKCHYVNSRMPTNGKYCIYSFWLKEILLDEIFYNHDANICTVYAYGDHDFT